MRKRVIYFLMLFLIINLMSFRTVSAESGPIMSFPNINSVDPNSGATNGRIPAEYANLLRLTSDSRYKVVGASYSNSTLSRFLTVNTEAYDHKPHYVEISNVGVYKGKIIDVRINVQNMTGTNGTRELDIFKPTNPNSKDFLHIEMRGQPNPVYLRYEFLDHNTGEPIPYKGTWIVKRINAYKNMALNMMQDRVKALFAYSNSALSYSTNDDFATTMISSSSSSTDTNDMKNQLMYSFDAPEGYINQSFYPTTYANYTGTRYVYYEYIAIAPVDIPHPSIIGQVNEESPKVSYRIVQDYPAQAKNESYPKRYKVTVKLDKILKMDRVKYKITNIDGEDVTSLYTISRDEANATFNFSLDQKTLVSPSFIDNLYTIEIESEIDWDGPYEDYLENDGYFHVPATMEMASEVTNSEVTEGVAKTKFTEGQVNIQYVLEDGKTEIKPSEMIEGGIGKSYAYKPSQLDIPNYIYLKTAGSLTGVFKKESQLIQFIYKKVPNIAPIITFDQQSDEEILYDGEDFKLSGQVSDEDGKAVSAFYKIDNQNPVEIEKFTQNKGENKKFDYSAIIKKEQLKDGNKHKIIVYAQDDEGLKSEEKSVTIKAFIGELQFISAPKEISFGKNLAISTKNKTYYITQKEEELIVKDTRIFKSAWKMSLKLQQPLTGSSGEVINSAVRYDNKPVKVNDNMVIFQQNASGEQEEKEFNISKDWIGKRQGLNLDIPGGKARAEVYTTTMLWTLEDTP